MNTQMRTAIAILTMLILGSPAITQNVQAQQESEILKKLRSGSVKFDDVDEALSQFREALKKDPSGKWFQARNSLAGALAHLQDFDTAIEILKQGFDNHFRVFGETNSKHELSPMFQIAQKISEYAPRSSSPQVEVKVLDKLIHVLRTRVNAAAELDIDSRRLIETLSLRCRTLPAQKARTLIEREFDRVFTKFKAKPESHFASFVYIEALKTVAVPPYVCGQPDFERIDELLEFVTGLQNHKGVHKIVWGMEFYNAYSYVIERILDQHPDNAARFVADAVKNLKLASENDETFERMFDFRINSLDRMNERIADAKRHLQIVGQSSPKFAATGWINGKPTELAKLSGKVVLLDFTAVWCGPCIQQIPDLKLLHKTFADRGLVVISVTEPYDYVWDDEKNRPAKTEKLSDVPDQLKLLERFAARYELPFRIMLIENESTLAESLGVTSIPHAVILDQNGIVRMIRKGNTRVNANAIHDQIESLLTNPQPLIQRTP